MSIIRIQTSAVAKFTASLTANPSLSGVTAGNTLLLLVTHANGDANNGFNAIGASDAQGSYRLDAEQAGGRLSCEILRLANANAGTHSPTVTALYGTAPNSFGQCVLTEWSGMGGFDQPAAVEGLGTVGPVSTGASPALSGSADVVIAAAVVSAAETGWGTPAGYTNIFQDLTAGSLATSFAYKTPVGPAAVTSNFGTMGAAANWEVLEATYVPSSAAAAVSYPRTRIRRVHSTSYYPR